MPVAKKSVRGQKRSGRPIIVGDNYLVPPAILRKGVPALSVANETCESILERQSLREEMDESSKDIEEEEEAGNLVQDIYTYLTGRHYPPLCGTPQTSNPKESHHVRHSRWRAFLPEAGESEGWHEGTNTDGRVRRL